MITKSRWKIPNLILLFFPYACLLHGAFPLDFYKFVLWFSFLGILASIAIGKDEILIKIPKGFEWLLIFTISYAFSTLLSGFDYGIIEMIKGFGNYVFYPLITVTLFYNAGMENSGVERIITHFCIAGVLLGISIILVSFIYEDNIRILAANKDFIIFEKTLIGNPNSAARYLVSTLSLFLWKKNLNVKSKIANGLAGLLIILPGIFITTSKSGLALGMFVLFWFIIKKRKTLSTLFFILAVIAVTVIGSIGVYTFMQKTFSGYYIRYSDQGYYMLRIPIWESTLRSIKNNLFTGVGAGNAQNSLSDDRNLIRLLEQVQGKERKKIDSHSLYLKIMVEGGLLTLAPFMIFLFIIARDFLSMNKFYCTGLIASFYVMILGGIFADVFNEGWFWCLIGVGLACKKNLHLNRKLL